MKKLILLSACLLALAARPAAAQAQAPNPDVVVVQLYDSGASVQLVVTRGEGQSEKIEFQSGGTDKRLTAASQGYHKLLSGLYREGYALQSTFTSHGGLTTLVLAKNR
jgi:opacity protein-like surface antigen